MSEKVILTLGEALIDLIPTDATNIFYEKCPGGAPANVAVGLAKLGANPVFIGKVGKDAFGDFLVDTMKDYGVDTSFMKTTAEAKTAVTAVTLGKDGERQFDFLVNPGADQYLSVEDINEEWFGSVAVLHIGSISMINETVRGATLKAVEQAKQNGVLVSYDPNYRPALWPDETAAIKTMKSVLDSTDILKISDDEIRLLTGIEDLDLAAYQMLGTYDIRLLAVTVGAEGSRLYAPDQKQIIEPYPIKAVDTTGAGDGFMAGLLYRLQNLSLDVLTGEDMSAIGRTANICGALAASSKGAMTALPDEGSLQKALNDYK